ncbi:MAG TPA: hypothetical protein VFJ30_03680 [Phycisphaerae bacterium]|nr:hypothetical protein [Phycisphaerae bacterium]
MMTEQRRHTLGLLVALVALAAAPAAGQEPNDDSTTVRIVTSDSALAIAKGVAEAYHARNPRVQVTVRGGGSLIACWQLGIGGADLAISEGPEDILDHRGLYEPGGKIVRLNAYFTKGQLRTFPLARHALAVVVHPQSTIDRMDDATLKAILAYVAGDRRDDPLAAGKVRYVRDQYACTHEMIRVVLKKPDLRSRLRRDVPVVHPTSKLLQTVAADKSLVGLTRVEEAMWSSGLRVLPVQLSPGRPGVLPTVANVLSKAYPYQTHLLLAVHPNAPKEAMEIARLFQGPEVAHQLSAWGKWITEAAKDPGPAVESIWPAAGDPSGGEPVRGAAAVLPTRLLTNAFLVGDASLYAALEDKVVEGIRRDGTLSLLDREHLAKVLFELKMGEDTGRPVISADVLVLVQVTTEQLVTFLRVQAFHSATATLLGEMKLPIDPARGAEFQPPLEARVAQWWPGVLRNLRAAGTQPVWAVRPAGDDIVASRKQADAVQAELQRHGGVFVARYAGLADAQQEVLLTLMGLARPQGAAGLPSADYLLEVGSGKDGGVNLCIRRGDDSKAVAEETFAQPGQDMESWIRAQATLSPDHRRRMRRQRPEDAEAARRQGQEELRRAEQLGRRYDSMIARLAREYNLSADWPETDQRTLKATLEEQLCAYERAAQLDPSREDALLGVIRGRARREYDSWGKPGRLALLLAAIRAEEQFLARFPRSGDRAEVLANHGQHCFFAGESASKGLQAHDERRVRSFFLAKSIDSYREYLEEPPPKKTSPRHRYRLSSRFCHSILVQYLPLLEPAKAEACVRDWSQTCDGQDTRMLHSDFLRLILLAHNPDRSHYRRDRAQYLALLAQMQKRWPDRSHFQWKQAGASVSNTLGRMCGGNRSFNDWLNGERGIGDLPFEGFDPNRLTGQVRTVCLSYKAPITWAAQSFRSVEREVSVSFQEPGRDDVGRFVRGEADLLYYVGALPDEDGQRLRTLCGKAFPGRLLGYLPPPDPEKPGWVQHGAKPRDPVYLLLHPRAEEQVIVFADWLETPEGRRAMARYFLASPDAGPGADTRPGTRVVPVQNRR